MKLLGTLRLIVSITEREERPIEQICQLRAKFWRWTGGRDWQRGKWDYFRPQ